MAFTTSQVSGTVAGATTTAVDPASVATSSSSSSSSSTPSSSSASPPAALHEAAGGAHHLPVPLSAAGSVALPMPSMSTAVAEAQMTLPKPSFMRQNSAGSAPPFVGPPSLSRQLSASSGGSEWRSVLSIEERSGVRNKLREAYSKHCPTYEELLETAVAIEEELLHAYATQRLDYFRAGIEFDNRVQIKKRQLSGANPIARPNINGGSSSTSGGSKRSSSESHPDSPPSKRAREN